MTAVDSAGDPVPVDSVVVQVLDEAIALVEADGAVTGVAFGVTRAVFSLGDATDTLTIHVYDRTTLSGAPFGVAISPPNTAYVTQIGGDQVARFNPISRTIVGSFSLPGTPAHVAFAPGGTRAYVTMQSSRELAVIDATSDQVLTRVPLGFDGFNLAVWRDGSRVFVSTNIGRIYDIDASGLTKQDSVQLGPATNGFAIHPTEATVFASSRDGGTVSAIDVTSFTVTDTYVLGGRPQRVAITPDGASLFIANEDNGIDVVDLTTGTVGSPIGLDGDGLGLAITPDGRWLYVTQPMRGRVRVVDAASRAIYLTIDVGGVPRNVAVTAGGTVVLIPNEGGWVDAFPLP